MWTLLQLTMFFVFVMLQVASAQNDCGNTSFSGPSGVITSPNFPLPYPHNLSCTYSIDVGRNNSVLLKFVDFDLELPIYADNCTRDWLMITCNEANDENLDFSKRYCGTDLPRTSLRFFNCPVVEVKFFADSSVNGGGFSIEYTVFENSTSAVSITDLDCGDTVFTSSSGFIRFPSNPTDYSASVNCTYTISTDNTSTFSLGVLPLQLPQLMDSFADCNRDYIMVGCVSDGDTELNPNTSNTYCRSSLEEIPVQRSHIIFLPSGYIVFLNCRMVKISIRSSDYNYRATDGFPFTVDSLDEECGTTSFTGPTGIVTSPQFPLTYPHFLRCFYSIDVDRTKAVSLDSLSFKLEGSSSHSSAMDVCCCDWLTVSCSSDGSVQENPNQNRKYCGEKKSLTLSYTNCDSLTLNFVSDSSVTYGGFQFRYTITTAGNATPSTPDVPEKHRVNATFTGPTGFITSPRFPLSYPHNLDYVHSIEVSPTKTVGLYFYSFNLEGTSHSSYLDTCNYDWLLISCVSESEIHHRNSKYCGEKITPVILSYSNCDSLTLNFISDSSLTSGGFKIWYAITSADESSCGNTSFSGSEGVVTSPNFPLSYPHNMNCRYTIDVGRTNSILLKFKHFDLQVPNSAGYCENDWLMITCNETTKANPNYNKKFCGTIQWVSSLRFVDCSSLVLEFSSGSSVLYKRLSGSSTSSAGFMIEYTVTENSNSTDDNSELECGATLFTNSSGEIIFPRNTRNYLATVNCTYTISANQKSYMWLNSYLSSSMQLLQSFQDCNRESLTIGCASEVNPNTTLVFCRRRPATSYVPWTPLVFADCLTLKLSIRSNTYDYGETFHIPFDVVGQNELCGNTSFSATTGIVFLPQIPFRYSRRINCLYTIDSGHVNSVALSVDHLYFGYWHYEGRVCNNGWLTITCLVNGESMAHPLADRKLCGVSSLTRARFPACRSVLFNYTSDDISSDKGFTIRYRIGYHELDCGTTLFTNSSGVIILPSNPTNYLATVNCTYTIATNNLSYIWLDTYFRTTILQSVQDCDRESVKVGCLTEGGTELNPSTARVFCGQETPSYDNTLCAFGDCRTLKLSILSSTYHNGETFSIPYSVVGPDEICGNTSFSDPTGVISSPRIPFRSSKCLNCLYTIDSGQVTSFALSIDRLMLGNVYYTEGKCDGNWLTITCLVNGTSMAHRLADRKLCGTRESIRARFSACRSVLVNFSSNDISSGKGFTIRYSMGDYELDCGTTLFTNSSGVIILPRNPTNYLATVNCTYTIATNNLNYIKLDTYPSITMLQSFQNCDRESVKVGCVSEGGVELNPRTTRVFCREESPSYDITPLTFTDCRTLKLSILSSTYDYPETFRIPFSVFASDPICGNTSFSAPAGVVSTPSFPYGTSRRVNCMYSINSGQVNSVVLSVDRLQCGYRYYVSSYDWLIITCLVNATSMAHPLANRNLCGMTNTIRARFPACHRVVFNFSSNYNYRSYDAGFTIRYRIGDHELDCGTTLFTNSPGVINLPRNPTNFLATVNCTYTISTNRTSDIWLKTYLSSYMSLFQSFQDCDRDSLTIGCVSDGGTELNPNTTKVLCRREYSSFSFSVNQLVFIDCRTLKLSIRSRTYDNRETTLIPFTVLEPDEMCGNTSFSALTGIVSSPRLPVPYPKRINCLYLIESGHVNSVVLSVDHLNLGSVRDNDDDDYDDDDDEDDHFDYFMSATTPLQGRVDELGSCNRGWLTITCLVNETSMAHPTADRKLCRSQHPIVARFPTCRSVLLNFSGDYTFSDTRFNIRYRIGDYDPECGNTSYSGPNGFITSPQFPLSYPHNLNCLYSIIGGQRHAISLSFISFRLYGDSYTFIEDDCYGDSLTVTCLSDESVEANIASSRKYCGIKTTPLTFSFPSCALVVLNFRSDEYVSEGGFKVRYTVTDLDIICGAHAHGPPSGTISLPWNYTDFGDGIECHYVINATEPSSISLTIWSISIQSSHGRNCHRDRLLINSVESQTALSLNVTHRSCDHHNSSVQLTFPGCTAIRVTFHGDFKTTGKTFRIEYTVTSYADDVSTTELPTTSISASEPVGTGKSCATGCEDSSDSSNCSDCLPDTSQTAAISISTDTPVTGNGKCGVGCEISADGTTCDCSTTQSDDLGVNTQMNLSGKRGRAVGISLTVIFLVAGAICLGAFLLFRRRREKNRSEMLLHASEEERAQMELEDDSTKTGSLFGVRRNQDRDTSKYLPLRPMSVNDHEASSTSSSATEIRDEMQPGL